MEKKTLLWISLILGVPALRLLEMYALVGGVKGSVTSFDITGHLTMGLIMGVGCALTAHMLKLSPKRMIWILPTLAVGYAAMLLGVTYPKSFFKMDAVFISNMLLMDLGCWAIAVSGAAFIGYVATRQRPSAPVRTLGKAV